MAQRIQQTSRMFLHVDVTAGGFVPRDPQVGTAVVRRKPFLIESPNCPALAAIQQLAVRLKKSPKCSHRKVPTHKTPTSHGSEADVWSGLRRLREHCRNCRFQKLQKKC